MINEGQLDLRKLKSLLGPDSLIDSSCNGRKHGLVWEDKPEQFDLDSKGKLPVLKKLPSLCSLNDIEKPTHTLIEGDNYHALKVLNYTHPQKIDAIYIDPPYNTGNKDFKYNDVFVDAEDGYRHSKWLSFMEKRLLLAKNLLTRSGVVFISIDENERASLELLSKTIFPRYIGEIVWDKRSQKGGANAISTSHEHILVFANSEFAGFNEMNKPNYDAMHKAATAAVNSNKGNLESAQKIFNKWLKDNSIPKGEAAYNRIEVTKTGSFKKIRLYQGTSLAKPDNKGYRYDILHPVTNKPCAAPSNGWVMPKVTAEAWRSDGRIVFGLNEKTQPRKKLYLDENPTEKVKSVFTHSKGGITDLRRFNSGYDKSFPYPKPVSLIKHLLTLIPKDSIILDFFAGSGTTAQAASELNLEDGGSRQCISITNNEENICRSITQPRISKVINGYVDNSGTNVRGTGDNLIFFRTDFVPEKSTPQGMKNIVTRAVDLITLTESTYIEHRVVCDTSNQVRWIVYSDGIKGGRKTLILIDEYAVDDIKSEIMKDKRPTVLYSFEYFGDEDASFELSEIPHVTYKSVPKNLILLYQRLAKIKKERS